MQRQPLEIQTLYAELLEQLAALEAARAIGHVPGTFVTKSVKGQDYYYFQHIEPGGVRRQVYVGRRDDVLDRIVERHRRARSGFSVDSASVERLCSILRAGGAMATDAASARVLRALSDAGVFHLGGVLVGTHAFVVIGNLLGVRWDSAALRTQDVDAAAATRMGVALPEIVADVPGVLESLEMGFLPVPGLDPSSPTTSFKVRGRGLRVDLLAPARHKAGEAITRGTGPVQVPRFKAAAQALPYLDILVDSPVRGALVDGAGVMVNVPEPGRFALHKLIVAGERPVTMHTKREKDLEQASQVLEVLLDDRPGDVDLAWSAIAASGKGRGKRVLAGIAAITRTAPDLAGRLRDRIARST